MPRQSDRARLATTAVELRNALQVRIGGRPIMFKNDILIEETDTDGWYVVLATMGPLYPSLQLWLDRWSGHDKRQFWFGYNAPTVDQINAVVDNFALPISPRRISDRDLVGKSGAHKIRSPLTQSDVIYPIIERFPSYHEYFFGKF
jgi:hypothetical protein